MSDETIEDFFAKKTISAPVKVSSALGKHDFRYTDKELAKILTEMDGVAIPSNELPRLLPYTFRANHEGAVKVPTGLQERAVYSLGVSISITNKRDPTDLKKVLSVITLTKLSEEEHEAKIAQINLRKKRHRQHRDGTDKFFRLICSTCLGAIKTGFFDGKHVFYCQCVEGGKIPPIKIDVGNGFPAQWKYDTGEIDDVEEGQDSINDN